ncbi:MAG TPA: hypothetical protein VGD98_00885 [Ktedonobacteraceae bacterium]
MDFSHIQHTRPVAADEEEALYVEELAGPDDYWLSITDAARVCRVQDVSIRRAITRKVLPVRRMRAGQNKRTRFVRSSDLAPAGFPIIDESAAITTQIGKLDILSIPQQQQQITRQHQELQAQMGEMQATLLQQREQIHADLHEQQERVQTSLQTAQAEQTLQLASTEARLSQEQQRLHLALTEASLELANGQETLRQDLLHTQASGLARDERLQTAVDTLLQHLAQTRADSLAQNALLQASLLELQQTTEQQLTELAIHHKTSQDYVNKTIERVEQEAQRRLLGQEQALTDRLQQFTHASEERFTELAQTLASIQQASADSQLTIESLRLRERELVHELQQQQERFQRLEQLLPLLPYAGKRLATAQDSAAWEQAQGALESRLLATQQREREHYQPLLDLLSPERLAILTRLLAEQEQHK